MDITTNPTNKKLALFWSLIQVVLTTGMILSVKAVLNTGVDPLNFSYQILITGSLVLFVYGILTEPEQFFHLPIKTLLKIVLIGIIGSGLVYALGGLGLKYSTATNYSFLIQTAAFFTAIFAFFILKENLKPRKVVLLIMLLAGVFLITTNGNLIVPNGGDILILLGTLAYAMASIFAKIMLRNVPPVAFTAYRLLFGGLSIILFLILIGRFSAHIPWLWTVVIGAIIAISTLAVHKVLVYSTASYASMMATMTPVLTAITGWILLREAMTVTQAAGGGLIILAGILINQNNKLQ